MKSIKQYVYPLILVSVVLAFFYQFFLRGLLPVPSDTIIGLYNPFRDLYVKEYPRGLPYKNFLVTDPVRQQYPWKNLVINLEKKFEIPLWNPYSFSGTPLLANFQSSPFYPLNLVFLIPSFPISWSLYIILQPVLAGIFLYTYLKNLKLDSKAALFGSFVWAFCGFSVAWMEWGVIVHTVVWMPLVLLALDKGFFNKSAQGYGLTLKEVIWKAMYVFAMLSSFFAGHLQTFFYLGVVSLMYFIVRYIHSERKLRILATYILLNAVFILLSLPQLLPTWQFILLSNRVSDQVWTQPGWFIPYQNFAQFIAPDFFGNPSTLNYFGVWNYGEFVGYVGIGALILAIYAVLARRDKKTYFLLLLACLSALFATQNLISQVPFILRIPFLSSAQPTRLMFVLDFALAMLAALGFDYFLKTKKQILISIGIVGVFLACLWIIVFAGKQVFTKPEDLIVAKNNLKLPTLIFIISSILLMGVWRIKNKNISKLLLWGFIFVVLLDLFRFGWKFTPFTDQAYLFPSTKITRYLQNQPGVFRIAATDARILPPNFSTVYKLQSIEGYDPLYLANYAGFIAAMERGEPNLTTPYGFNRIITPHNYMSPLFDLLNVGYILSFDFLPTSKFTKVLTEGKTKVYKVKNVLPRAFFVKDVISAKSKEDAINKVYASDVHTTAVVEGLENKSGLYVGRANITKYSENEVVIETTNNGQGFLVLTDTFYPIWKVYIDETVSDIYRTDYAFRGVLVPAGRHTIKFKASLF